MSGFMGGITAAQRAQIATIERNLGVNTLRDQVAYGWSVLGMIDGVADEFEDQTGIGSNTNGTYDAANDWFSNPGTSPKADILSAALTSTLSPLTVTIGGGGTGSVTIGTIGGQSAAIVNAISNTSYLNYSSGGNPIVANFDAYISSGSSGWSGAVQSALFSFVYGKRYFTFRWDAGNLSYYNGSGGANIAGASYTHSTWQSWQIEVVSVGTFTHGTYQDAVINVWRDGVLVASAVTIKVYCDNAAVNGDGSFAQWNDGGGGRTSAFKNFSLSTGFQSLNMTLVSVAASADAQPSEVRGVLLLDPVDAVTINTDCTLEFSRDGGTTWEAAPLTLEGTFDSAVNIYSALASVAGQPAGTSIKWRFKSLNNKQQRLKGVWMQWS